MCYTILYAILYGTFLKLCTWLESAEETLADSCNFSRAEICMQLSYSRLLHKTGCCGKIAKYSATNLSDVLIKHLYITQFYM